MSDIKILVTCPPMLGMKSQFIPKMNSVGIDVFCPDVKQTLSEQELICLVPDFDGWVIGDDPATRGVFEAGKKGRLKAAVKWGVGVDNVDFAACNDLAIPITNTPNMFGGEVADLAVGYLIALARETFVIDREIRLGGWPKNRGISLAGKTAGVIGFGDIGKNVTKRLFAFDMEVICFDPAYGNEKGGDVQFSQWPCKVEECDFLIFTCSLNGENIHMLDAEVFAECKQGLRIVNVARGPLIDQRALIGALDNGVVHSAALDVFEVEPLPKDSRLRDFSRCIFGAHNGSNTKEAVARTNDKALDILLGYLGVGRC